MGKIHGVINALCVDQSPLLTMLSLPQKKSAPCFIAPPIASFRKSVKELRASAWKVNSFLTCFKVNPGLIWGKLSNRHPSEVETSSQPIES